MTRRHTDELVLEIHDASVRDLLVAYLERRRLEIDHLREALRLRDFEALGLAGHRMHGSGGSYGVERISELGAELEDSARSRDGARAVECLNALERYLGRISVA